MLALLQSSGVSAWAQWKNVYFSKGFLQSEVLGELSVLEGRSSGRSLRRSLRRSFRACFAGTFRAKETSAKTSAQKSHDSARQNWRTFIQKNPRDHKHKIGTPPPAQTPPPKRGILRTWFFLQKERIFPGVHKIGAPISGPRIADTNFTDTRIFLIHGKTP